MPECNKCHNTIVDDRLTTCPVCEAPMYDKNMKPSSYDAVEDANVPMEAYMKYKPKELKAEAQRIAPASKVQAKKAATNIKRVVRRKVKKATKSITDK